MTQVATEDSEPAHPTRTRMKLFFDHYLRGKKDLLFILISYLELEGSALPGRQQKKRVCTLKLLK